MPVKHVISVSGGKDSTATLLLALERCPAGSVVPIFCDTGNEHEETYAYLGYLEQALGVTITRLKADFTEQLAAKRLFIARDVRTGRDKGGRKLRWPKPGSATRREGRCDSPAPASKPCAPCWRTTPKLLRCCRPAP